MLCVEDCQHSTFRPCLLFYLSAVLSRFGAALHMVTCLPACGSPQRSVCNTGYVARPASLPLHSSRAAPAASVGLLLQQCRSVCLPCPHPYVCAPVCVRGRGHVPCQLWWVPLKCCPLGLGPTITDMMSVRLSLISPKAFSCRHCLCVSLHRLLHPCMCSQRMAREQKDLLMLAHSYTAASLRGCVTALLVLSQPVPDGTSTCMPQVVCVLHTLLNETGAARSACGHLTALLGCGY